MENIKPVHKLTNARYGKHKVVELNFPKRQYSKTDMEQLIRIQQEKYAGNPLTFMPAIHLDRGYRSMKAFTIDTPNVKIDLYDEESNKSDHFVVYVWKNNAKKGGNDDKHNDCLFYCFVKAINVNEMPDSWSKPYKWKKRLGLERDDQIDVKDIPIIENKLKCNVHVTGDCIYTSSCKFPRTANIKLVNNHYTYNNTKTNDLIKTAICFKEQKMLMCYECDDKVYTYDGVEFSEISIQQYWDYKSDLFGNIAILNCKVKENLQQEYEIYIQNMKSIKEASKGLINYWKSGGNHKRASLILFHNCTKGVADPEIITELEESWIMDAFTGGLIFGENIELDSAISYDINSAYPNILRKSCFRIPMKQGRFSSIDEFHDVIPFGIYRVRIHKSNNKDTDKLFRFNPWNKYTHTDIYTARKLNLKIELMKDDEANALLYGSGTCITSSVMFKNMVTLLYELKRKKVPFAKEVINSIWGALCEKNMIHKVIKQSGETFDIPEGCRIVNIRPHRDGHLVQYSYYGRYFKLNYARFAPFLTATVRKLMADTIYPYKEDVYRCHTDSILSSKPIPDIKLSTKIGDWKIDHSGKCKINSAMSVKWE